MAEPHEEEHEEETQSEVEEAEAQDVNIAVNRFERSQV